MATLQIGRRHTIECMTLEDAVDTYCRLRDESGEGASSWPNGLVTTESTRAGRLEGETFHVSYNGRVWTHAYGHPDRKEVTV